MNNTKSFDKGLLKIMACPLCKTDLKYNQSNKTLTCIKCNRKYPIRDGIPIMLPEESKK